MLKKILGIFLLTIAPLLANPTNINNITYPGNMVINSNLVVSNNITLGTLTSATVRASSALRAGDVFLVDVTTGRVALWTAGGVNVTPVYNFFVAGDSMALSNSTTGPGFHLIGTNGHTTISYDAANGLTAIQHLPGAAVLYLQDTQEFDFYSDGTNADVVISKTLARFYDALRVDGNATMIGALTTATLRVTGNTVLSGNTVMGTMAAGSSTAAAYGALQRGNIYGIMGTLCEGAEQAGKNISGRMTMGSQCYGAKQFGVASVNATGFGMGPAGYGALQGGWIEVANGMITNNTAPGCLQMGGVHGGLMSVAGAQGSAQFGAVGSAARAIVSNPSGAMQLLNITTGQTATNSSGHASLQLVSTNSPGNARMTGQASVGIGSATVSHHRAIVVGNGRVSQRDESIDAPHGIFDKVWLSTNLYLAASGTNVLKVTLAPSRTNTLSSI